MHNQLFKHHDNRWHTEIYSPGEQASVTRIVRLTDTPLGASEAFLSLLLFFLSSPLSSRSYLASKENKSSPYVVVITAVHQIQLSAFQAQDRIVLPVPSDWGRSHVTGSGW